MMTKEERNEEMINSQRMIIQNERGFNAVLKEKFQELCKFSSEMLDVHKKEMNQQFDIREELQTDLIVAKSSLAFSKLYHEFNNKTGETNGRIKS